MIQFNLLPDVKLKFIRAQKMKRSVILISMIAAAACLFVFVLLILIVDVFQKTHLHNLNTDIKNYTSQLQQTSDLNKILTVQNQLNSLPDLHAKKPVASRLSGYIAQIVPNQISISKLDVDFDANTMTFSGSADSINSVNTFIDTLKFTTFSAPTSNLQNKNAFNNVVLTSFSRDDKQANYQVDLSFDPAIFSSASNVTLTVPTQVTTRSTTEKPNDTFQLQKTLNTNTKQ